MARRMSSCHGSRRRSGSRGRLRLGAVLRPVVNELEAIGIPDWFVGRELRRIVACGTGELGHFEVLCESCGHRARHGHGCQSRHCPSCGQGRAAEWVAAREAEVVQGPYFHFVFTVPGALYPLFLANQRLLYGHLMREVRGLLHEAAADPRFLGGTPWVLQVLHTTNRDLGYHPHVHVIISGVGWNEARGALVSVRKDDFLFPARMLAYRLRQRMLGVVRREVDKGTLALGGAPVGPGTPAGKQLLEVLFRLSQVNWQVHTKRAFGGPAQVLRYLGRYTHRTAISNGRLVRMDRQSVTFRGRHSRLRRVRLAEFARLFARHVLPKGFVRVRRSGLLSPQKRKALLARVQAAAVLHARVRGWRVQLPALQPERGATPHCDACASEEVRLFGMADRRRPPLYFGAAGIPPPVAGGGA